MAIELSQKKEGETIGEEILNDPDQLIESIEKKYLDNNNLQVNQAHTIEQSIAQTVKMDAETGHFGRAQQE